MPSPKNPTAVLENFKNYSKLGIEEKRDIDSLLVNNIRFKEGLPIDTVRYNKWYEKVKISLFDTIAQFYTDNLVKLLDMEFAKPKADFFKLNINSNEEDWREIVLKKKIIEHNIQTPWCKQIATEQHREASAMLASVNESVNTAEAFEDDKFFGTTFAQFPNGAKLYLASNMSADDWLMALRNEFNQKSLLFDFWATWCSPCVKSFPYSIKLYNETRDYPLEFIYICTSDHSTIDKWKFKIGEYNVPGIHIYMDENLVKELRKRFEATGLPSYVLVKKDGSFANKSIKHLPIVDKEMLIRLID